MKNNKGFTLIELLAVIVILAVIALIATPIIMNVINDSKKGADKDSAYGYMKAVEVAIGKNLLKDNNIVLDGNYLIDANGNLERYNKSVAKKETLMIDYKGIKPEGTLVIKNQEIIAMDIKFDIGSFSYDGKTLTEKVDRNLFPIAKWEKNPFSVYNGAAKLVNIQNGELTVEYTGAHNLTGTSAYTNTDALHAQGVYNPNNVYNFGIIVKPNTTYVYSAEVSGSVDYRLYAFVGEEGYANVVNKRGAENKNMLEFTTGATSKYVTLRVDIYNCVVGDKVTFKNFKLIEK